MFCFLLAQIMSTAPSADLTAPATAPPIAYVSVRGDARSRNYLAPTWNPSGPRSALPCPKRGDKKWSETINFPAVIVRFDCPVGVAYKTWEPSGRRVHIGIKSTTSLHPGVLPASGGVTYELVAPQ